MNTRWTIIGLVAVLLAGAAVFLLRDRIADGPFPHRSKGVRFFSQRQPALDALIERLNADGAVARVTCYEDEVWIEESEAGGRVELAGTRLEEYLALCRSAGVPMGWRLDGGFLFHMGEGMRSGRDFQIALLWHEAGAAGVTECSALAELGDSGQCDVPLDSAWTIHYEWIPGP